MSRIGDLVQRGVRVTVANQAKGEPAEIPADFFEVHEPRPSARFDSPAEIADFAAVYEEAEIPAPFNGYGVDRMAEILESKRLAALPREVRVAAVMASLEAAGVSLPQVVRDAVVRERALAAFVAAKERDVAAVKQRIETRVATIRREMEAFVGEKNAEIESLTKGGDSAGSAFAQLQLRKRQEQERLHQVLSHFVPDAANPVPVGG
jgi:flagellar motility protein MotE (MotC chaperone)